MPAGKGKSVPEYELIDLGTLGGRWSEANAINRSGQVVGTSSAMEYNLEQNNTVEIPHAFLYSTGKMIDLNALVGLEVWETTYGKDINNTGDIVGNKFDLQGTTGFLCSGAKMSDVQPNGAVTWAINAEGQVVLCGDGGAFLYSGGNATSLGIPDGCPSDINDLGQVVGSMTKDGTHAFLYGNGKMTDLGSLSPPGAVSSYAHGINSLGQVVGESWVGPQQFDINSEFHAFYYSDGRMIDLGAPGWESRANSINRSGEIVGRWTMRNNIGHAALWKGLSVGAADLNDLIAPNSGWELNEANDINDSGQIVGTGTRNGQRRAFLLKPIIDVGAFTPVDLSAIGYFVQILAGAVGDSSGFGLPLGGPFVSPIGPGPVPFFEALPPHVKDALVGLVLSQIAPLINNAERRSQIEHGALELLKEAVENMLGALNRGSQSHQ